MSETVEKDLYEKVCENPSSMTEVMEDVKYLPAEIQVGFITDIIAHLPLSQHDTIITLVDEFNKHSDTVQLCEVFECEVSGYSNGYESPVLARPKIDLSSPFIRTSVHCGIMHKGYVSFKDDRRFAMADYQKAFYVAAYQDVDAEKDAPLKSYIRREEYVKYNETPATQALDRALAMFSPHA